MFYMLEYALMNIFFELLGSNNTLHIEGVAVARPQCLYGYNAIFSFRAQGDFHIALSAK